jgi:uncharacterized protein DUF3467
MTPKKRKPKTPRKKNVAETKHASHKKARKDNNSSSTSVVTLRDEISLRDQIKKTIEQAGLGEDSQNVNIESENVEGTYSNLVLLANSKEEFVLDFAWRFKNNANIVSRIILNPNHARRLLDALKSAVTKYEEQFGELNQENREK